MWAPGLEALDQSDALAIERVRAQPSGRLYTASQSCLLPGQDPRKSAIKLVEHRAFDPIILAFIMANCCTMAWE